MLVGSVDVVSGDADMTRRRLDLPADSALAEGSHWFLLGEASDGQGVRGGLRDIRIFSSVEYASDWLSVSSGTFDWLYCGDNMNAVQMTILQRTVPAPAYVPAGPPLGFYETSSGRIMRDFLDRSDIPPGRLALAQADDLGAVCIVDLEKA